MRTICCRTWWVVITATSLRNDASRDNGFSERRRSAHRGAIWVGEVRPRPSDARPWRSFGRRRQNRRFATGFRSARSAGASGDLRHDRGTGSRLDRRAVCDVISDLSHSRPLTHGDGAPPRAAQQETAGVRSAASALRRCSLVPFSTHPLASIGHVCPRCAGVVRPHLTSKATPCDSRALAVPSSRVSTPAREFGCASQAARQSGLMV